MKVPGRGDPAQVLCFEEKKADQPAKLFVMEVGRDKDAPGGAFRLAPVPIPVPADAAADFPVAMCAAAKHDVVYMVTKMGYLYLFDCLSGKALYRARITTDTIFVTCAQSSTGGILGITARKGQLLQVALNEATLVPHSRRADMPRRRRRGDRRGDDVDSPRRRRRGDRRGRRADVRSRRARA